MKAPVQFPIKSYRWPGHRTDRFMYLMNSDDNNHSTTTLNSN